MLPPSFAPAPTAVEFWPPAVAELPKAVAFVALAVVPVPTATEFEPLATAPSPPAALLLPESTGELVLLPPVLETNGPVTPPLRPAMAWSTALSCEPLTASVLVGVTCPAATLVMVRGAAAVPTLTVPVGERPA